MKPNIAPELANIVAADERYKVLTRLEVPHAMPCSEPGTNGRTIAIVDVETSGLDPATDTIIELAVMTLTIDWPTDSRVLSHSKPVSWLQDPERELDERITQLTGLDNVTLANKAIDDEKVSEILGGANLIIAHNARFDRAFIDRRYPELAGKAWACSCHELDWLAMNFDGRSLGHLLMQTGQFNNAHRAADDVWSLFKLLTWKPAPVHSRDMPRSLLDSLVAASDEETYRIEAVRAPFRFKDKLKARGYRWDVVKRVWWTELRYEDFVHERGWFDEVGLPSFVATPVNATQRHI